MKKVAIVTGASRGIGYETTIALASKGHQVVATARSEKPLEKLKQTHPEQIGIFPTDLTKQKEVSLLSENIGEKHSSVDILINNAGALVNKPFMELDREDWEKMMEVNLYTAVDLIKSLVPFFSDGAHILNISSMGGFQGSSKFPGLSAYSVAKGALSILSECLAIELGSKNIHSNALCLGAVQTEMLQEAFPGFKAPVSAKEMGAYIADFALNGNNFYNGQVLPVTIGNPE